MDLDLWNDDFQLAREWGLDMPIVQPDGQYGDLKQIGRLDGDTTQNSQPQGTNEDPSVGNEDVLGIEWLESSDLGSFLNSVGGGLPLEDGLLNFSTEIALEDSTVKPLPVFLEQPSLLEEITKDSLVSQVDFDALDTPVASPDSPVQVTPVIKLEDSSVTLFDPANFVTTELRSVASPEDSFGSPLSADDVDSVLSSPSPSSPGSSLSSIIETSPELYKIITNSTAEKSRFSPYQLSPKQKTKSSKNGSRTRKPAELVPEGVIMEHLNKKDRKKLQNKNAAIRYRMKKKEEATGIKAEVDVLEEINSSLKNKVEDLNREIKYMKNLMEEVCKAKGIII